MNWIISSILMFFSSAALYLVVRKSSKQKISAQFNNLAMFLVPLFVFLGISLFTRQSFSISIIHFIMILGVAIIFSYLGNLSSLISMEKAPNPGYSLVISKSYVLFTSLVAVFLFDAQLTSVKILAILMIVIFSALILVSNSSTKTTTSKKWIPLAFVAFFCWGMLSISSKYLLVEGVNLFVLLTYVYAIVTACILFDSARSHTRIRLVFAEWKIFLAIGLLSAAFNAFQFYAISTAPNIGYVNAINAASIAAVTVGATFLFKDELSMKKLIGVIGVTVGLVIMMVG